MKLQSLLLGLGAAGGAALLLAPSASSWATLGGSLPAGTSGNGYQRDVRVFNDATDSASNNNTTPNPAYPGALGAVMAIWKGSAAWNSDLTSAGKNFDSDFQGEVGFAGSGTNNIVDWGSSSCGGSTLAWADTFIIGNGWRIHFCDPGITWADGPGSISGSQYDIQAVMAHEYGHALGLGHTSVGCGTCNATTMCPFTCNGNTSQRVINADDAAGLAAVYGEMPAGKPIINNLSGSFQTGQQLIINGSGFDATVRVKFSAGTTQNTGSNIPGVVYNVPASPTQVTVTIPAAAQDGNVLVWEPPRLSNPAPIDIGGTPPVPPQITSVTPGSVTAFLGGGVTLDGSGFTGATLVNVGGAALTAGQFTVVDDGTITFNAPTASAFGAAAVTVTTPNGTSNASNLTFVETDPPKLNTSTAAFSGVNHSWQYGGGASDLWFLYIAADNSTFDLFGFPFLQNWIPWASGLLTAGNGTASFSQLVPPGLQGVSFYSQMLTLDDQTLGFVGASQIFQTTVIL